MKYICSIEPDERGFWHINAYDAADWSEVPEGRPCDSFATTKTGASVEEAIALARSKFHPTSLCVWDTCVDCSGTGEDAEGFLCDECDGEGIRCEDVADEEADKARAALGGEQK